MYFRDKYLGGNCYTVDLRRGGENSKLLAMYRGYVTDGGYIIKLYLKKLALGTRYGEVPGKITLPIHQLKFYKEKRP